MVKGEKRQGSTDLPFRGLLICTWIGYPKQVVPASEIATPTIGLVALLYVPKYKV